MQNKFYKIGFSDLLYSKTHQDKFMESSSNDLNSAVLWKNDKAYLAFSILSEKNCQVNFSSTITPCSDKLNATIYQLNEVEGFIGNAGWYAFNRKGILPSGPKKSVGDVLSKGEKFELLANQNTTFIIEIKSQDNIVPGKYTIDISTNIETIKDSITCCLNVLNLDMPKLKDYQFNVEYWQHPFNISDYYGVQPFSKEHIDILYKHMEFYRDLGGKGITASIVDEAWGGQTYGKGEIKYPSLIKWIKNKNGDFTFDYTWFDTWCGINSDLGNDDKIICYSMMPWGSNIRYYDELKSKFVTKKFPPTFMYSYKKIWTIFLNDFITHLDEKKIFDKIYIGFDERVNMSKVLKFLSTFKNAEGKKFKISASFNSFLGNSNVFDQLDYASVGLDEIRLSPEEFKQTAQKRTCQGKSTTLYTAVDHFPNSFTLSQPMESYWSVMYAYSMGANGFLRWAFDAWVENPLKDTTHSSFPAGDCFLVYPQNKTSQDKSPQWSLRLIKLDEGVRDINKLIYLTKFFSDADKEIKDILKLVKPEYSYDSLKDNSWGVSIREAKWADDNAKIDLARDMLNLKNRINSLAVKFSK